MRLVLSLWWTALGCRGATQPMPTSDACDLDSALATCVAPTMSAAHYIEQSSRYFDTMDTAAEQPAEPLYSELVARWEWPPWLKLTGFTAENIIKADTLLRIYPSTIPQRDCRAFDQNPFGRCRVTFFYEAHEGRGCPIYEEFTFNEAGEITFIEAWSDQPGLLPMSDPSDTWAEGTNIHRLSTRIPGLGNEDGRIDLSSKAMAEAEADDEDVADFAYRARDWSTTWFAELEAAGDDMWERGCGW